MNLPMFYILFINMYFNVFILDFNNQYLYHPLDADVHSCLSDGEFKWRSPVVGMGATVTCLPRNFLNTHGREKA